MSVLPAFADLDADFAVRLPGGLKEADRPRAQAALDDASTEIRAFANKTWVDTDGNLDLPTGEDAWRTDVLIKVCCSAALRSFENPEGLTQDSVGSYSEQRANQSLDVYLTSSERRDILRAANKSTLRVLETTRSDKASDGRPFGLDTPSVLLGDDRPDRNSEGTSFVGVDGGDMVPWIDADGF